MAITTASDQASVCSNITLITCSTKRLLNPLRHLPRGGPTHKPELPVEIDDNSRSTQEFYFHLATTAPTRGGQPVPRTCTINVHLAFEMFEAFVAENFTTDLAK